jgi:AP-2 complex subunit mu-1
MYGGRDYSLELNVGLIETTVKKHWSRPPILLNFSVVMYTASGVAVRYLK